MSLDLCNQPNWALILSCSLFSYNAQWLCWSTLLVQPIDSLPNDSCLVLVGVVWVRLADHCLFSLKDNSASYLSRRKVFMFISKANPSFSLSSLA